MSTATKRKPMAGERKAGRDATRLAAVSPSTFDAEARTVDAVFSTETPVRRFFGNEILDHAASAIDLAGFVGAPVLDTHDRSSIRAVVARVETARIQGRRLVGTIRFSNSPEGEAAMAKVAEGMIRDVSVGYTILRYREARGADNEIDMTATRWRPYEVSLTAVGADRNAKIRSKETRTMDPEDELETIDEGREPAGETRTRSAPPPTSLAANRRTERQIEEIRSRAIGAGLAEADVDEMLDGVRTVSGARAAMFEALAEVSERARTGPGRADRLNSGDQQRDLMADAVRVLVGGEPNRSGGNPYYGNSLSTIARSFLDGAGASTRGMNDARAIEEACTRSFHTTSDFPTIFIDGVQRFVTERYQLAASALKPFSRKRNLPDFRSQGTVRPSSFPRHEKLTEAGEIKFSTFDIEEGAIRLASRAVGLRFSRELLVNDRLNVVQEVLEQASDSATADEADMFFELLSDNAFGGRKLSDGKNLFHADHGNLAAAGAALGVTSLSAARQAMRTQKGVDRKRPAGTAPAVILVGPALETAAEQLVATINATSPNDVNPFAGKLRVAVEDRYDGNGWWVLADPKSRPVFIHGYLDGWVEGPRLRMDEPFGVRGLGVTSEFDFGCGIYDHRAIYFNPGASGS